MTKYQVAIVVPIFNVESYLADCLASIDRLAGFHNYQVVLVDDGSTDLSSAIASAWLEGKANAMLFRQENQGLGAARNSGLALVDAEFVAFLDADDQLPENSISILYSKAVEDVSEIVVGKIETFPSKREFIFDAIHEKPFLNSRSLADAPLLVHNPSACNKIFSTKLIKRQKLTFSVGTHFEDVLFTIPALIEAYGISIVPDVTYLYRKRTRGTSIMDTHSTDPQNYWDHLRVNEILFERYYLKSKEKEISNYKQLMKQQEAININDTTTSTTSTASINTST
jgi:glycosyltransferase involved in cell wall biosynthesis